VRASMRIVPILVMLFFTCCRWACAADRMVRGSTLENPELISGSWESDQFDSVVGLHIKLMTTVAGAHSTLVGVKQVFHHAEIQVYQRDGPQRITGDGTWFLDDSQDVQWTEGQIVIEHAAIAATPAIQLNLIFDSVHSTWKGHLRRGTFDHDVTLIRPHPKTGVASSPFVGTWYRGALMNNCLHIVQTGEDTLAGWSDDLITPGRIRYANGIKRPSETIEQYGSIAIIEIASPTTLLLQLKAFSAICCSITSGLHLPAEIDAGKHASTGVERPDEWRRVEGTSCVNDASRPN
jgi:hypothetical protein